MKTSRKVWMAAGAASFLLAFSLWGFFGGGRAAEIVPEPVPAAPGGTGPKENQDSPEGRLRYDSGGYQRSRPLADPFQGGAAPAEKPPQERKASVPAGGKIQREGAGRKAEAEAPAREPVLKGVIAAGAQKRAIIQWDGSSYIAGEGEKVGLWTVEAIQGEQAVLTGPPGEKVLVLSRGGLAGVSP